MLIDLHLHTTRSDGVWEPERLFEEIRARELALFCVSDHDTLDAYPMPDDLAQRSVPGLEVDTEHDGHTAHVLAYGVGDVRSPLLQALIRQRRDREERMMQMILRDRRRRRQRAPSSGHARAGPAAAACVRRPLRS